jgi:Flp pilus assembly protein protease CpaA
MNPADLLLFCGAAGTLLVGAAVDLRSRRIPNAITFGSAILGFLVNLALRHGPGAGLSAEGWLAGIGILLLPFIARGVGGGDVKLLAAVGAWTGPGYVIQCLFWAALAGCAVALGMLVVRGQLIGTLRLAIVRAGYIVLMAIIFLVPPLASVAQSWLRHFNQDEQAEAGLRLALPFGPALAVGGIVALAVAQI